MSRRRASEPEGGELRPGHLPGILCPIAERAGMAAALRLAREWGGSVRSFPAPADAGDHDLARIVGPRAAEIICGIAEDYPPRVSIPSARSQLRWAEARRLRRRGWTHREIARKLYITEPHSVALCAGITAPPRRDGKGKGKSLPPLPLFEWADRQRL